jgi:hypothetical protein
MMKASLMVKDDRGERDQEALEVALKINGWAVERGFLWERDTSLISAATVTLEDSLGVHCDTMDGRIRRMLENPGPQSLELWNESMTELQETKGEVTQELGMLREEAAQCDAKLAGVLRDIERLNRVHKSVCGSSAVHT